MQTFLGIALIGIPLLLIFAGSAAQLGFWQAFSVWAGAAAMTAMIVAGLFMLVPH